MRKNKREYLEMEPPLWKLLGDGVRATHRIQRSVAEATRWPVQDKVDILLGPIWSEMTNTTYFGVWEN
jgi:hypothetical protein